MKRFLCILLSVLIILLAAGCGSSPTQTAPEKQNNTTAEKKLTNEEIANLKGPDREKILVEGAKKEGKLTWYTNLIVDQAVRPLVESFQKKYPFIKVEYYRGNDSEVLEKVLNENRAKQYRVDVIDGYGSVVSLKKSNLLEAFSSPILDEYPNEYKDRDKMWAVDTLFYQTMGYNTDLVSKNEVPKTYEDLLNPKWKGKLVWNANGFSGGPGFIGIILTHYGEEKGMEYLKKLKEQNVINVSTSARAVLDRVIAGEYPIALQIFNHHAVISAKKGAPSNQQPLEPVLEAPNVDMLLKNAPNPYSAMLFLDFIFDKNGGQQILKEADYLPAHPDVPAKYPELKPKEGKFKALFLSPEILGEKMENWDKIYKDMFLKK